MLLERIKKKCKEQNISIARLEKEAGLGNATVRCWDVRSPSVENLQKVCAVLGVTLDDLLREDGA